MAFRSPRLLSLPTALAVVLTVVLTVVLSSCLALVVISRLGLELDWFAEFGFESVLWRRWWLQIGAFLLVMGLGVSLQLQQLQRCWRLRSASATKTLPRRVPFQLEPLPMVGVLLALHIMAHLLLLVLVVPSISVMK